MIYARRIHVINEICAHSGFQNVNRNVNQEQEEDQ